MYNYIPDYPRPQMVREPASWENLNGTWDFAFDDQKIGIQDQWYRQWKSQTQITVPFTYETKKSGIGDETPHETVWYSRTVTIPMGRRNGKRLLIHFEGSDYHTILWVNGVHIGEHTGGYSRFSFDISQAVKDGENTITVMVSDPMDEQIPRGKQRWLPHSYGCWYVQTTGIWKTVWLEYVPQTRISRIKLTPDITRQELIAECEIDGPFCPEETSLELVAGFEGRLISRITTSVTGSTVKAAVPVYHTAVNEWGIVYWSPESPNLYDLELILCRKGRPVDRVTSYFGMREIKTENGQVLLNGAPLYQRLILDQGYWEDSHLTPPSEAALIKDIDTVLQLGYNGVRKHQKVEDERFLYWCDVKGLLVWGEMASPYRFGDRMTHSFIRQWSSVVRQNYNHPCIITWTPVNESWGVPFVKCEKAQQDFTKAAYYLTKSLDPYRPVIVNDGWEHTVSDILTLHDYEEQGDAFWERYTEHWQDILAGKLYHNLGRAAFAGGYSYCGQPVIISEFGGIAFQNDGQGWGYGNKVSSEEEFLSRFDAITTAIQKLPFCCGFCYTQLTDVQQEVNGLLYPDRSPKFEMSKIKKITEHKD